jgi:aspartate/methionine/tyrosine aminotransferase
MHSSRTKANMIARLANNSLLQTPAGATCGAAMRRPAYDLAVDQLTAPPGATCGAAILASSLEALERGETHYVEVPGIAPLRERLSGYLQEMGLAGTASNQVFVTAGIQESRFLALQILGEQLGRATGGTGLPSVVHPGARQALGVRAREITEIWVEPDGAMLPSPAAIETGLQAGVRLLYLESPCRLTGAVYDGATVQALAGLLETYDAAAIWDQGLAPWVEGYSSLAALPRMAERVAVIGEAWPGVGLESWQVGYIGLKPEWLEPIRAQKQIMTICTNTASQYAAVAAEGQYAALHRDQLIRLAQVRQEAIAQAARIGVQPLPGAAVNLLALRTVDNGLLETKLGAAGYSWANGADFGAPGACPEALRRVIRLAVTLDGAITQGLAQL